MIYIDDPYNPKYNNNVTTHTHFSDFQTPFRWFKFMVILKFRNMKRGKN